MKSLVSAIYALLIVIFLPVTTWASEHQTLKPELPFYFPPGIIQTSNPMRQYREYFRFLNASTHCYEGEDIVSAPGTDSIHVETDIISTSRTDQVPRHLMIIFDDQIRRDGKIYVTTHCDQKFITEHEFEVEKRDMIAMVNRAADLNFAYYQRVTDLAIAARAKQLGVPEDEFRKHLDEKIESYNVTYREYNHLPKPQHRSDFVMRELHFGVLPEAVGATAATWLNTGVVYYTPVGRVLDYIMKEPETLAHEGVHNNTNFQRIPLNEGFDVEFMASIPQAYFVDDKGSLMSHPYLKHLREIIWVFFGFNFNQVQKEIQRYDLAGNTVFDEEKFNKYTEQLEQIKSELSSFFRDVVIPTFYADPLWWEAFNARHGDKNAMINMLMAEHYNLTILGGGIETMKWLEAHRDEINRFAKEADEETIAEQNKEPTIAQVSPAMIALYKRLLTTEEQQDLERYFTKHPEEIRYLLKHHNHSIAFFKAFRANRSRGNVQ